MVEAVVVAGLAGVAEAVASVDLAAAALAAVVQVVIGKSNYFF